MKSENDFTITKEDQVKVDFYSELMKNHFPETTIQAEHDIRSIMIAEERPMVFFLDKTNRFKAVLRKEGSTSGWIELSLSKNEVKSFELEYDIENESIRIAEVEKNRAWVSQELQLSTTDFENLEKIIKWDSYLAEDKKEVNEKVSVGVEHLLFATTAPGMDAQYHVARFDEAKASKFTLPEHGMKIVQFELGNFQYTRGVFLLYDIGKERSLLYQSFPDPEYGEYEQARFETGEKSDCFALLGGLSGQDTVYASGKNNFEFEPDNSVKGFSIAELPSSGLSTKAIRVARHGQERSIWTLHEDGLRFITNRFFNQATQVFEVGRWTELLVMSKEVDQFSYLKGPGIHNQLFTLSTGVGNKLTRFWQDGVTSLWNKNAVAISEATALKEVDTYTAHVRFAAKNVKRTFNGLKVNLNTDSNLFIYVNSKSYHIGPDRVAEIPLGISHDFTIICPVSGLSSGNIYLDADFLNEVISIALTKSVLSRLEKKVQSGEDLEKATKQNGERLVPDGTDIKH